MSALGYDLVPLVQRGGGVGKGDVGLLHDAEVAGSRLPAVGGSQAEDRPLLVVGDVIVLLLPDIAGEGGFVGLISVVEGCLVTCKPLLEGVGREPDVLLGVASSFHSAFVHQATGLALSIKGAGWLPAVATFCFHFRR